MSVIDLIPISWSKLVSKNQREAFSIGDWVIKRNESFVQPCYVYKVVNIIPRKVTVTQYAVDCTTHMCSRISSNNVTTTLQKSQIVKACILSKSKSNQDSESACFYGENHASSKLLLSRLSWNTNSIQYQFSDFSVSTAYKSVVQSESFMIPAIQGWENDLQLPISKVWPDMIRYLNDSILLNKTKEKLYKIYTRALPVGRKIHNDDSTTLCCFCNNLEDELHCFVYCIGLQSLWEWVLTCMAPLYPWIRTLSSTRRLFGFANSHYLDSNIQVWKLFHAEFIRLIWYSRCRKLFDNELIDDEAIKGMLRSRVQQAVSIHELYLKSTSKANLSIYRRLWTTAFPNASIAHGRLKLGIH
jgi:hypothetical protein